MPLDVVLRSRLQAVREVKLVIPLDGVDAPLHLSKVHLAPSGSSVARPIDSAFPISELAQRWKMNCAAAGLLLRRKADPLDLGALAELLHVDLLGVNLIEE